MTFRLGVVLRITLPGINLSNSANPLSWHSASAGHRQRAQRPDTCHYNLINGKKPEQELTLIPVELITKENVNQYKGWSK